MAKLTDRTWRSSALGLAMSLMVSACAAPVVPDRQDAAAPVVSPKSLNAAQMWHSTVLVENGAGHGTGVIVGEGSVLTAYHVVDAARPVIEFFGGERRTGRIRWGDKARDLAIISVEVPERYPIPAFYCGTLQPDQRLVAIGHPLTRRWVSVEGPMGHTEYSEGSPLVALSFDLSLGNSGGPVFDDAGRVVGIASEILVPMTTREIAAPQLSQSEAQLTGLGLMIPAKAFCADLRAI